MTGLQNRIRGLFCALVAVVTIAPGFPEALGAATPAVPEKIGKTGSDEPCRLTPQEKHWMRNPESQWPPSRRERLKRCDDRPVGPVPGIKTAPAKDNRTN